MLIKHRLACSILAYVKITSDSPCSACVCSILGRTSSCSAMDLQNLYA